MYNNIDKKYIYLDNFLLSLKKKQELVSLAGGIENICEFVTNYGEITRKIVGDEAFVQMKKMNNDADINALCDRLDDFNIYAVTLNNPNFPEALKNLPDAPMVLYTKGDLSALKGDLLAVVGTRRPTRYGRDMVDVFSKKLSNSGVTLVSGLAFGIDTCVAQTSVDNKKPTIAVLAGGLDNIYPSQNQQLSQQIIACGGLLVSEYPPLVRPTSYSFLERNRIISGLSVGTLIVEAGERSGATSTANWAIEQGRELFVIPGNINSYASVGCNNLINMMPDCFCISVDHILNRLGIKSDDNENDAPKSVQLSLEEQAIIDALGDEEMTIDDLAEATGLDGKFLMGKLTTLEIGGIIKKLSGNYYAKISLPK